jgi:hypothetical protein
MDAKTLSKEQLIEEFDEVLEFTLKHGLKTADGTRLKNGVLREITGKDQVAASNDNRVKSGNKAVEGFIYISKTAYIEVSDNEYRPITFDEATSLKNSDVAVILKVIAELAEDADFLSLKQ